jgi:hypothetical protein
MTRPALTLVPVPDDELTEAIHLCLGPRRMACGAEQGVAVFDLDLSRVTCQDCLGAVKDAQDRLAGEPHDC